MLRIAMLMVGGVTLGACSSLDGLMMDLGQDPAEAREKVEKVEDATLGNAARVVGVYCNAPYIARGALRERLNARPEAEGAEIGVYCPGDPALTLGE